jgi:hypothetical protein
MIAYHSVPGTTRQDGLNMATEDRCSFQVESMGEQLRSLAFPKIDDAANGERCQIRSNKDFL